MTIVRRIPAGLIAWVIVLLPLIVMAWRHWHHIPLLPDGSALGIGDPDPWLRLTLVYDWLNGGSWYDHSVARTNAPFGGISSPWTRPLDMVIAAISWAQPHDVDLHLRLVRTALLLPTLWAGLMMLGLTRAAQAIRPLTITPWMIVALAFTGLSMWGYFAAGYADHHTLLAVLFVWVLGGILPSSARKRTLVLNGVLLGIMLWMSPEALILIGGIFGWYGLRWLSGEANAAQQLRAISLSLAAMTLAALLIERPSSEWLLPVYDSISVVYVLITALCALSACLLALRFPPRFMGRMALAILALALPVGGIALLYPAMLHGPLVGVDPYIFSDFLPRITEARPLSSRPWLFVAGMLAQPLVALGLMLYATRGSSIYSREVALKLCYFLLFTLALYCVEQRWYYYFYPLVIIALAPWLAALMHPEHPLLLGRFPSSWMLRFTPEQQAVRRMPLVLLLLGAQGLLLWAAPEETTAHSKTVDACHKAARSVIHSGALDNIGDGKSLIMLASTDLGAEILFWSKHRIIASNYHREGVGIRYVWEADTETNPAKLRSYLAQRQVDALILCPIARDIPGSVLQGLVQGNPPPPWLTRVNMPAPLSATKESFLPVMFLVKPKP